MIAKIYHNDDPVSGLLWEATIDRTEGVFYDFDLLVTVTVGEKVRFAVAANGTDFHDSVGLVGEIEITAIKDITTVDRLEDTPVIDVFSGDSFTYTIEVPNVFEQLVYFRVQDTLDAYLDYDLDTLTVNGIGVSNAYFSAGVLDYDDPAQVIGLDETLSLSLDVKVKDLVPDEAHDWMINNVATITAYTSSGAVLETMDTNLVQTRIENPGGNPVPEPDTMLLLGLGLVGLAGIRRMIRKK